MSLPAPVTYSVVSGTLPAGISLGSDGFLSGVASVPGTYTFVIRAVGSDSTFTQRTYSIVAIEIAQALLPNGTTGTAYAEALTQTGMSGSITWSISNGALPAGIALAPFTGVLSGTATESGDFLFTVSITNGTETCSKDLSLTIEPATRWWWPLETVGNQVDVLSGLTAFQINPGTFTAPAGKVNNGALLTKNLAFDPAPGFSTGIVPELAYAAADGFTFCGWTRRVSGPTNTSLRCVLSLFADAGGVTTNGNVSLIDALSTCEASAVGTPFSICSTIIAHVVGLGTYFFFALSFDPATGKTSFQIDNGAVQTSVCSVIIPASPFGTFQFNYGATNPLAGSGSFDEVALFYPKLTQTQIDYIFNAGVGRTPPITLP